MTRADELKEKYNLKKHPEGGWFLFFILCDYAQIYI